MGHVEWAAVHGGFLWVGGDGVGVRVGVASSSFLFSLQRRHWRRLFLVRAGVETGVRPVGCFFPISHLTHTFFFRGVQTSMS